jgi:hypothetical protein
LGGAYFELFGGWLISGMDESTPGCPHKERFDAFLDASMNDMRVVRSRRDDKDNYNGREKRRGMRLRGR